MGSIKKTVAGAIKWKHIKFSYQESTSVKLKDNTNEISPYTIYS